MSAPAWWHQVVAAVRGEHEAHPGNLPGAAFAVETLDDGPLIASVGDGWADNTICAIFSMSKAFTATALLIALEEHRLFNIEMPVCRFPGMETWAGDPVKSQIKVRHLLQHTSGLPTVRPASKWPRTDCNDAEATPHCADAELDLGPTAPWIGAPGITNECVRVDGQCRPARTLSLDQVAHHVMTTYPLIDEPGRQYSYATANLIVAGRLVEKLTGESVNRYVKKNLFAPLDMHDSFYVAGPTGDAAVDARIGEGVTAEQRARIATPVNITQDGRLPAETAPGPDGRNWDRFRTGWRFVYPDGGMYSTVADLLAFLRLLRHQGRAHGKQILSPAIVRLLSKDQGFNHTMGFGFRPQTTPYGQGAGTLEHLGHMMTYFWLDPCPGNPLIGVFLSQRLPNVAVNTNMGDGMKVIFKIFVAAVKSGKFGQPAPQPAPEPTAPEALQAQR